MGNTVEDSISFGPAEILRVLPHRPPFLFVDRVTRLVPSRLIIAERDLRADEPHFAGHFPGRPIMPGVLISEALAQTSGLLIGLSQQVEGTAEPDKKPMFFLAVNSMKYVSPAVPGETLILRAEADKSFGTLFRFNVEASVGRRTVGTGSLTLTMVGEAK
ncbi:MAG: 3-hydroxyacyl-ACP dehydratase FabZ [bacterium]